VVSSNGSRSILRTAHGTGDNLINMEAFQVPAQFLDLQNASGI
jgi:hypothetical protein